jgi:hypothetical protein
VLGHIATLSPRDIEKIARMGLVITTHTNSNVYKSGHLHQLQQTRAFSVEPVWAFVDGLPANHGHHRNDVAQPGLIDCEWIGSQEGEVGELAGLGRALLALVEGEIGIRACAVFMTYDFKLDNLTRKRRKVR